MRPSSRICTFHTGTWNMLQGLTQAEGKDFQVHGAVSSTMKRQDREAAVICYAQRRNKVVIQGEQKHGKQIIQVNRKYRF